MYPDSGIANDLLNSEMMCAKDIRARIRTGRVGGKQYFIAILLSTVFPLAFVKLAYQA